MATFRNLGPTTHSNYSILKPDPGGGPEPVISTTADLRRRPDGGRVHLVDDPFFS